MTHEATAVGSRSHLRRVFALLLAVIALLLRPGVAAQGTTITAASCSSADIQAAINTASNGDVVQVPAGNCTWTSNVTIPNSKGITLQGAGSSSTIITMGGTRLFLQTSLTRKRVRVTGFKFIKTNANSEIRITGTARNWRIDNNIFDGGGFTTGLVLEIGDFTPNLDAFTYGLIDHNQFFAYGIRAIFVQWARPSLDAATSPNAAGNWIWGQPAERGTAQAVYIEDNVFNNSNGQQGQAVDARWGAKYVLRYNTFHNQWTSTHSGCTNLGRNAVWVEYYGNTSTSDPSRPFRAIEMRSVSGIVWNNSLGPDYNTSGAIGLDNERSFRTDCGGGPIIWNSHCDGTKPIDENSQTDGYRCLGQPGWGQPQQRDMSAATFQGVFAWDNRLGGAAYNLRIQNNSGNQPAQLVAGRDFFNMAQMTKGLIANRPTTCNPGPANRDVYISTDENSQGATLYICSAADTWTKHWEPFEYPHPLTLGLAEPPTNLRKAP